MLELLAVIAIIGILLALLLPAVQQAREAARRTQCRNNLRQIGLAIHNYESTYQVFPPGGITMGHWDGTPSFTTWTIAILPQLDQQPLFNRYDANAFNESPLNAFVREQALPVYVCPSDSGAGQVARPESGPGASFYFASGSYRAVSGFSDGLSQPLGGSWFDSMNALPRDWRGAMHHVGTSNLTTEAPRNVLDGLSQTLMVGEYSTWPCPGSGGEDNGLCRRSTFWAYTYTSYNQSSVCPDCGSRTLNADYDACAGQPGSGGIHACKRGWGSFHPGGLHFLMCDGSVRFISLNVDLVTLGKLATIAGREVVEAF